MKKQTPSAKRSRSQTTRKSYPTGTMRGLSQKPKRKYSVSLGSKWLLFKGRKRSGNNTSARQWLYIMGNLPYIWTVKVGITGSPALRLEQVNETNKGFDFYIFKIRIPFAWQVEQWVHEKMSWARVYGFEGSGRTERFWFIAIFPTLFGAFFVIAVEWGTYIFITIALLWAAKNCTL